jgi:hypothetical protein
MRCGRFTLPFFAVILAGLVAMSLVPWSISAAVTNCLEPADLTLVEAGAATPTIDGEAAVAVEAVTKTRWRFCAAGASCFVATPALSRPNCHLLDTHTGRAPPVA